MEEINNTYSNVELYANSLYSGMILKGNLCLEDGRVIYPANRPLSKDFINDLLAKGIKKIYYQKPLVNYQAEEKQVYPNELLEKAYALSEKIGYAVVKRTPLPEKEINETVEKFIERVSVAEKGTLLNLAELEEYDEHTYFNAVNVALVSVLFGKLLSWKHEQIKMLGIGALLHDVGKLLITKEILNKKNELTEEEFEIIKKHATYGYSLLKSQTSYSDQILKIALMHHETWDGTGYPMGITRDKLEDMPQIVSICDYYVAVTSDKIYRDKFANWKALIMIRKNAGTKFNPRFAAEFINRMPAYLVAETIFHMGDFVELNTNEIGEVIQLAKVETLKPTIKIYINGNGEVIKYPLQINLELDNTRWIETIIEDKEKLNRINTIKSSSSR